MAVTYDAIINCLYIDNEPLMTIEKLAKVINNHLHCSKFERLDTQLYRINCPIVLRHSKLILNNCQVYWQLLDYTLPHKLITNINSTVSCNDSVVYFECAAFSEINITRTTNTSYYNLTNNPVLLIGNYSANCQFNKNIYSNFAIFDFDYFSNTYPIITNSTLTVKDCIYSNAAHLAKLYNIDYFNFKNLNAVVNDSLVTVDNSTTVVDFTDCKFNNWQVDCSGRQYYSVYIRCISIDTGQVLPHLKIKIIDNKNNEYTNITSTDYTKFTLKTYIKTNNDLHWLCLAPFKILVYNGPEIIYEGVINADSIINSITLYLDIPINNQPTNTLTTLTNTIDTLKESILTLYSIVEQQQKQLNESITYLSEIVGNSIISTQFNNNSQMVEGELPMPVNIVDIEMYQGDTWTFNMDIVGNSGHPINLSNASVYFTVKADLNSDPVLQIIQPEHIDAKMGKTQLTVLPNETSKLEPGEYLYDFAVVFKNNIKWTLQSGKLIIYGQVTKINQVI